MRMLMDIATELAAMGAVIVRDEVRSARAAAYKTFLEGLILSLTLSALIVIGIAFLGAGLFLVLATSVGGAGAAFITGGIFVMIAAFALFAVYFRMTPTH